MNLRLAGLQGLRLRNVELSEDKRDPLALNGLSQYRFRSDSSRSRKSSIFSGPVEVPNFDQLRKMNARTIVDTFFSLHIRIEELWVLVHVSEVIYSNLSPHFRSLSLPPIPRGCNQFQIKVWARQEGEHWRLLALLRTSTTHLHRVQSNNELDTTFGFELDFDGHSYVPGEPRQSSTIADPTTKPEKISYNFEAIRSITKLDVSVRELLRSKQFLSDNIDKQVHWLFDSDNINNIPDKSVALRRLTRQLQEYIRHQRARNDTILHEIIHHKVTMDDIRNLVDERFPDAVASTTNQIEVTEQQAEPLQEGILQKMYPEIGERVHHQASLVLKFVPINNCDGSVRFSVVGIDFPTTIRELLDGCYEAALGSPYLVEINAGLGYILQVMHALAEVLGVRMGFRMQPHGCESVIYDMEDRPFELYYNPRQTNNRQNVQFERALHLLNQNLQQLIHATSAQLKYLNPRAPPNPIPHDSWDNLLWRLQWLLLMVTAPG